jgi:hypothetical protein
MNLILQVDFRGVNLFRLQLTFFEMKTFGHNNLNKLNYFLLNNVENRTACIILPHLFQTATRIRFAVKVKLLSQQLLQIIIFIPIN